MQSVRRLCKILGLTITFALVTLGVFKLNTYIALTMSVEITILSFLAAGVGLFLLYKFLMKLL